MALLVPNEGEKRFLQELADQMNAGMIPAQLRAYTNNYTPVDGSVIADFTQATFPGYAGINLTSWGIAGTDGSGDAAVLEVTRTFTRTVAGAAQLVYGIYVVDTVLSIVLYAEKFTGGPISVAGVGEFVSYLPRLTLRNRV